MRVFWNAGVVMFLDLDAGYTDVVIWWKKFMKLCIFHLYTILQVCCAVINVLNP